MSEAWSIDWQTHGDSAALNEAVIEAPDFEFCKPTVFGVEVGSDGDLKPNLIMRKHVQICIGLFS